MGIFASVGDGARTRRPSPAQTLALIPVLALGLAGLAHDAVMMLAIGLTLVQLAFVVSATWRALHISLSLDRYRFGPLLEDREPNYTIMVALHDEAEIVDLLIARLKAIDYPRDRLQALLLVEAHDRATLDAIRAQALPTWMELVVVPAGRPLTKPRALNHGLALASGELLTVYDAEDEPHPLQLREAAARFATGGPALACLQAPLHMRRLDPTLPCSPFIDRQFAVEYAALFHVTLPAMARLRLPFPLGGTSNHFRTAILKSLDGWDAYNVTEDADLGYRLWRHGFRSDVITRPTLECPPCDLRTWLPQRTRWLKGYMQTFIAHTRSLDGLGWRGLSTLILCVAATVGSAAVHAPAVTWVLSAILVALAGGQAPMIPAFAIFVFAYGTATAWWVNAIGARRAGIAYGWIDRLSSLLYWSLMTLAFVHAAWRLVLEPHAWDKTPHRRDAPLDTLVPDLVPNPIISTALRRQATAPPARQGGRDAA